jgi:cytochrome P450
LPTAASRSAARSSWTGYATTRSPTTLETGQPASTIPRIEPGEKIDTTAIDGDVEDLLVTEREHWPDGPPHALFERLRGECPVHWTREITEFPESAGFWSVTRADDVHEVSRDWQTYSSERGGITAVTAIFPLELMRAMFIGMDPPKHDRIKALFQAGFTPKRIAAHEEEIRRIVVGVLDRLEGRETCDLVADVAQPAVARVIGSFMGIPPEDDVIWARLMNSTLGASDPDLNPGGIEGAIETTVPEIFARCGRMIAARRENPTDDLTSVLVHAEVDGERLEEHEIVMGFFLLVAAGNDSTKATYCSGMRALMEHPDQRRLLLDDPSRIPGAVEESLRMFPAFAHFRRTATRDTELNGQEIKEGDKVVMWYASSNRDESRYEDPDHFDVLRNPEHQAFGAGGRHFCLGTALARLELRILFEETLARYPEMGIAGSPKFTESAFLNQLKTLPVRLSA